MNRLALIIQAGGRHIFGLSREEFHEMSIGKVHLYSLCGPYSCIGKGINGVSRD